MVEHVIIGILIVLCAVLAGTALKNQNYAAEYKAHHEITKLALDAARNDLAEEIEKRQSIKAHMEGAYSEASTLRNQLDELMKRFGAQTEESYIIAGELEDEKKANASLRAQLEPKKVTKAAAKKAAKKSSKPSAKKSHGQHELS